MRFEEAYAGWTQRRLGQVSHRRAPVDEVMRLVDRYRKRRVRRRGRGRDRQAQGNETVSRR